MVKKHPIFKRIKEKFTEQILNSSTQYVNKPEEEPKDCMSVFGAQSLWKMLGTVKRDEVR